MAVYLNNSEKKIDLDEATTSAIASATAALVTKVENIKKNAKLAARLQDAGVYLDSLCNHYSPDVVVPGGDLEGFRALRPIIGGKCQLEGRTLAYPFEVVDAIGSYPPEDEEWVKVRMRPVEGPFADSGWDFVYFAPLTPDCKCKVVETTSSTKSLACDV